MEVQKDISSDASEANGTVIKKIAFSVPMHCQYSSHLQGHAAHLLEAIMIAKYGGILFLRYGGFSAFQIGYWKFLSYVPQAFVDASCLPLRYLVYIFVALVIFLWISRPFFGKSSFSSIWQSHTYIAMFTLVCNPILTTSLQYIILCPQSGKGMKSMLNNLELCYYCTGWAICSFS